MKMNVNNDAMGNRISKTVINKNVATDKEKSVTTYYVRDPQGSVMAVYEKKEDAAGAGQFQLKERHLYGINRLGMVSQNVTLAQFDNSNVTNGTDPTTPQAGDTHYELTNHLGNVMAVISDEASTTAEPTVVSLSDYYPFGMAMGGRIYSADEYRYGFNGKEIDKDGGFIDFGARLYNDKIGRFLSLDPFASKTMLSYGFAGNRPLMCVDLDGCIDITYQDASVSEAQKKLFETIVNNAYLIIQNCEDAQRVIMEQTQEKGKHNIEKIYEDLKKESKVKLDVQPYGQNSNQLGYGDKNGIHIASELLPQLEKAYNEKDEILYQALSFGVAILVIHEYVHHKDAKLNGGKVTCTETTAVQGKQKTNSKFGHRSLDVDAAIFGVLEYAVNHYYQMDGIQNTNFGEPSLIGEGTMNYSDILNLFKKYIKKKEHNKTHGKKEQSYTISDYVTDANFHKKVYDLIGKYMEKVVPQLKPVEEKK